MPHANPSLRPFERFLEALVEAPNETAKRELFIALAATGFQDSELSTQLALGAEHQVKFSQRGLVRRGAVDSFHGNLIIEFENKLVRTRAHALVQLQGYCAGAWREDGDTRRAYLAVATDGTAWEVFAPRLLNRQGLIDEENIELVPVESWEPSGLDDAKTLRQFLNRLLFRTTLIQPTAENFARDFGVSSPAYMRAQQVFTEKLIELHDDAQLVVLREAWDSSLQAAYGHIDADTVLFAQHTYLAILARLMVWAALEHRALDRGELEDILTGMYFEGRMIANLSEQDFFHWHAIPSVTDVSSIFVGLADLLAGYDLTQVQEDVLKPLYEQLVDDETRHGLGEFYTPDWLCKIVTEHLLSDHSWSDSAPRILDPACGSGSFVRSAIDLLRARRTSLSPEDTLREILSSIYGIDVHPLSVIVAKATYLLAIQDLVPTATEPITLPVFLANSLALPTIERQGGLFGQETFSLEIAGTQYSVPAELIYSGADYDTTVERIIETAKSYGDVHTNLADIHKSVSASFGKRLAKYDRDGTLLTILGDMARQLAELIRRRQNSVHGFLLKNHYRPSMLRHTFDYIIGNPPWLTVGDIKVATYKDAIVARAKRTKIAPRAHGDQSHTELASLFLVVAVEDYLTPRKGGDRRRIAFVMPRSIFTAKHHRNLREGLYTPRFDVLELWDLDKVSPLFKVPACVLFAGTAAPRQRRRKPGRLLSGRLPKKEAPVELAVSRIASSEVEYELAFLGKSSAWRPATAGTPPSERSNIVQPYARQFRQGAVLYPQTLLVVEQEDSPGRTKARTRVRTARAGQETARIETKPVNHIVESKSLFSTAVGEHILPFVIATPLWTVLLPVLGDPGQEEQFIPVDSEKLRAHGRIKTAEWLDWAESEWKRVRKDSEKSPLYERLDYAGHLTAQGSRKRHVVLYTAAGNRPVAGVLDTEKLPLPFVARDRTYWASFASDEEALFLSSFLNSSYVNRMIHDWINRGLFGKRDINKRVLNVPWPRYSKTDPEHTELVSLGSALAQRAEEVLAQAPPLSVGRLRRLIRSQLDPGTTERVEELVAHISAST